MKKLLVLSILPFLLIGIISCDSNCVNNCTLLASPSETEKLSYEEYKSDNYSLIYDSVDEFNSSFSYNAYSYYDNSNNFCVSPVSIYMLLAISSACANGNTKTEILNALNISEENLNNGFDLLYRSLNVKKTNRSGDTYSILDTSNSIWINEGVNASYSNNFISKLASDYYCYSYKADFKNDNKNANYAIREFVKEQTRGLIDVDFDIPSETLFSLVNCLYLKDIWNEEGDDITISSNKYEFISSNGSKQNENFLVGDYITGKAYETTNFKTFYIKTYSGYKIKFIVPNDDTTIDEVFTKENISLVNSIINYNSYDSENNILYETRCIFPEFEASYDEYIDKILEEKYDINELLDARCDFSNLFDNSNIETSATTIRHITDLKVDRKGIEGAAVTIETMAGDGYSENTMTIVKRDFIVDKSFGFIITDGNDMPLFTGVINNI